MEKVIFNLLSNAVKHSPKGTQIKVRSVEKAGSVVISVKDCGEGISEENLSKIFDPFFQVEQGSKSDLFGSGIGLNMVQYVVRLHKGKISVESTPGHGAEFLVELNLGKECFAGANVEFVENREDTYLEKVRRECIAPIEEEKPASVEDDNRYRVLVVEDDDDMRQYIVSLLSQQYIVYEASNGKEGLKEAVEQIPDLIVSDVMMPRMNGYELCKNIKEDITISHIPIILLTARDDKQSQLSGYKNGADAYLTKPFEIEMLMEIIRNRLKNRESIKKRYLNTGLVPAPEESTFSQADETFLLKLNKIIQEHLDSSNLDVTFICKEIGMSRASLYNKLKALTDMGANDYINKFRMEKAITLITSTDMSFTEIAEKVGFTTSRYFSTAFKQYTGETPTQYKEKRKQEKKNE